VTAWRDSSQEERDPNGAVRVSYPYRQYPAPCLQDAGNTRPRLLKSSSEKIPLESVRAGVEDDSIVDNMVNDLGLETDMSMESKTSSRSAISKVIEIQVCVCGWSKATTVRGLKVHQGKNEMPEGEGTRALH